MQKAKQSARRLALVGRVAFNRLKRSPFPVPDERVGQRKATQRRPNRRRVRCRLALGGERLPRSCSTRTARIPPSSPTAVNDHPDSSGCAVTRRSSRGPPFRRGSCITQPRGHLGWATRFHPLSVVGLAPIMVVYPGMPELGLHRSGLRPLSPPRVMPRP